MARNTTSYQRRRDESGAGTFAPGSSLPNEGHDETSAPIGFGDVDLLFHIISHFAGTVFAA